MFIKIKTIIKKEPIETIVIPIKTIEEAIRVIGN